MNTSSCSTSGRTESDFECVTSFIDHVLDYKVEDAYVEIQSTLPSKQLIHHLRKYVEENLHAPLEIVYRLCYIATHHSHGPVQGEASHLHRSCPHPRVFGKNDSVVILETACFKLSNGFEDTNHAHSTYSLLEWIGRSADASLLKDFFRQENPAVAALWWDLIMGPTQNPEQYLTLIEAGLDVRGGEWFRYEFDTDFFNLALVGGRNPRAERAMDVYITTTLPRGHYTGEMRASVHRGTMGVSDSEESWIIRIWVEARNRLGTNNLDLEGEFGRSFLIQDYLQVNNVLWLLEAGASGDPDFLWVPAMRPLIPDWSTKPLPRSTWKRMQYLSGLRHPQASSEERSTWFRIALVVWSIYSAAMQVPEPLEQQMRLLFDRISPAEQDFALQMTLSEAIDTSLLPVYEVTDNDTCLGALPKAAGLRNHELVAILIEYGVDLERLRPLALYLVVATTEPLTTHDTANLWSTMNLLLQTTAGNMAAPLNIDIDTLHLTMRALGRLEAVHPISNRRFDAAIPVRYTKKGDQVQL
ncbi:uncharacterized protein PG986_013842 [Apiospora aurea]|uniref:Uncharacterized protein n=1 Tax=Apiospora aurea TaxID=335848 RepID=A0ABR1PWS1_9PEZI